MKKLIIVFLALFLSIFTYATNHYVDSLGGNDLNNGSTTSLAWSSIAKVNSIMATATIQPGDSILFIRGGVWHNRINISKSGINFGCYGLTGAKPLISGFMNLTGWTNVGNIWTSGVIPGTITYMSTVALRNQALGDSLIAMGRWPNAGTVNGGNAVYNSLTSITSIASVSTMPFDFVGGQLCWRKIADILGRERVISISGTTINFNNLTQSTLYKGFNGNGYFVQDLLATLDAQNEWFFDVTARRMKMFSLTAPTNIKVSYIDTLFFIGAFDNISVSNIAFEGGNTAGIDLGGPTLGVSVGTIIKKCDFNNIGRDAIHATADQDMIVDSCYLNHILNNGISMSNQGGNSTNVTITHNTLKNIGYIIGMGFLDYPNGFKVSMEGITNITSAVTGEIGMKVRFNSIDTVGHIGIRFFQNNTFVDSNFINYFCFITDDAGGINAFDNFTGLIETNRTIIKNTLTNGIGNGIGNGGSPNVNGIYIDDKADGIEISGNNIANIAGSANNGSCIYIHNGTNLTINDNNMYNGGFGQITFVHDANATGFPIRNIAFNNNILFSKLSNEYIMYIRTKRNDIDSIFNGIDNNVYARPILPTGNIIAGVVNYQATNNNVAYTLITWKSTYATALNGAYDPNTFQLTANSNPSIFLYNYSEAASTNLFPGLSYIDVFGSVYNNSINIDPYTSITLIYNGPVASNTSNNYLIIKH